MTRVKSLVTLPPPQSSLPVQWVPVLSLDSTTEEAFDQASALHFLIELDAFARNKLRREERPA
jgi:hypothetical protein